MKRLSNSHRMRLLRMALDLERFEKLAHAKHGAAVPGSSRAADIKDAESIRAVLEWIQAVEKEARDGA